MECVLHVHISICVESSTNGDRLLHGISTCTWKLKDSPKRTPAPINSTSGFFPAHNYPYNWTLLNGHFQSMNQARSLLLIWRINVHEDTKGIKGNPLLVLQCFPVMRKQQLDLDFIIGSLNVHTTSLDLYLCFHNVLNAWTRYSYSVTNSIC